MINKDYQNCKHSIQSLAHRTRPGGMREAIKLILIRRAFRPNRRVKYKHSNSLLRLVALDF